MSDRVCEPLCCEKSGLVEELTRLKRKLEIATRALGEILKSCKCETICGGHTTQHENIARNALKEMEDA